MIKRIWIIDDEPTICWALRKELERAGHDVEVFGSAESCVEHLRKSVLHPDVVLLDVRLPGRSGLELLGDLQALPSHPAVIVMTAFGDLKVAVEAMRGRAFEYLTKPFDLANALHVVQRAIQSAGMAQRSGDAEWGTVLPHDTMLGDSAAMQGVYRQIAIAAQSDAPVLIDGEPGTGKSLVARMIHRFSSRASEPLVFFRPDADHVPESDAELYGTCLPSPGSGVASGPIQQPGLMLLSGCGTLVIDEVVQLSIASQAKLLGAIETGWFQAVASAQRDPFRARILFTSTSDLDAARNDGELYEPLAAQMRVINIHLPPLRERRSDIRTLARAFLADISPDPAKRLSDEAVDALETQRWPGNVRQLRQAIQHAAVHSRGSVIRSEDLPTIDPQRGDDSSAGVTARDLEQATRAWLIEHRAHDRQDAPSLETPSGFLYEQFLAIAERALIEAMLEECGGNRAAVASRLGMHRTTLRQKMKRYGL